MKHHVACLCLRDNFDTQMLKKAVYLIIHTKWNNKIFTGEDANHCAPHTVFAPPLIIMCLVGTILP